MRSSAFPSFLLVEDDRMDATIFQRALKKAGLEMTVDLAANGRHALDHLRHRGPDRGMARPLMIILDLNLPQMGGFEFLQELRADPALRDHVVFVLTTSRDPGDVQRAYDFNVAGYLTKSSAYDTFVQKVCLLGEYANRVDLPMGHVANAVDTRPAPAVQPLGPL